MSEFVIENAPVLTSSEQPGKILRLQELPDPSREIFEVAKHEAMHGLIDPANVLAISAYPKGEALGWTLMREFSDVAAAAGIVHGEGYGSDKAKIIFRALEREHSPGFALANAIGQARDRLSRYHPDVINLVAKGLAYIGRPVSGDEFRWLLNQAHEEVFQISWPDYHEEEKTEEVHVEINENSSYPVIPKEGRYKLTVYRPEGYTIETYENGVLITSEIWVVAEDGDEDDVMKKYRKKFSLTTSFIQPKVHILPPGIENKKAWWEN